MKSYLQYISFTVYLYWNKNALQTRFKLELFCDYMFSPLFVMPCTRSGLRRSSLQCHRSVVKGLIGPSTKILDCQQQ